jgi:CRP/FNR family cyclic AMP-dependent transcriptional regulator
MRTGRTTHPFLAGLTPRLMTALNEVATQVYYPDGYRIFDEDGAADHFWLIEHGTVAVDLHVPGRGGEVLETIGGGGVLGWSWLYPPYRWRFGATALDQVAAIEYDAATVRRRCAADPEFGHAILSRFVPVLAERLHTTRLRLLDLWGSP